MNHLIEFPLEENGSIVVEVYDQEEGGLRRAGRDSEKHVERASQSFEHALSKIRPATEKVIATFRNLAQQPDEVEMEFGFNLSAAAGVIIAAASTQANYKVILRWSRKQKEPLEETS